MLMIIRLSNKLYSLWQKLKTHSFATILVVCSFVLIIVFVNIAYEHRWHWTGFTGGEIKVTSTTNNKGIVTTTEHQLSKTLWDWLGLLSSLAIPVVVGFGATWYTAQQNKVSNEQNADNQRENLLQSYIDNMSELMLEKKLRAALPGDEVRTIGRSRTLAVLPRLDSRRKKYVFQFLFESKLLTKDNPVILLRGADFSYTSLRGEELEETSLNGANLSYVDFRWANLNGVSLIEANLRGANLWAEDPIYASINKKKDIINADFSKANFSGATLENANFSGANLSGANLSGANLRNADLRNADLSKACLMWTNLRRANLSGVNLKDAELDVANLKDATGITVEELENQTKRLENTIYPDGKRRKL